MGRKKTTSKNVTLRFRVDQELANLIKHRSKFFFDGNMSEFFRHCVDHFTKPNAQPKRQKQS
jgi:hypothetical protein